MRLSLWIGLIFAFSVGMCCAVALRTFYFEAKPEVIQVRVSEPTTQILVATKTIPGGIAITADFVAFVDVPLSEVPVGALSDFNRVYRRQPAYPIPVGCPICEDLLLPETETATEATFIPPGSQFVTLDIVHLRQGHMRFSPNEPLATMLDPAQHLDVRLVPRNEMPGRLAELKNQVLQNFSTYDSRNSGELILENVPIHQIQRRILADPTGMPGDSLVLILDRNEAAKLTAAAGRGQIRVLAHRNEQAAPIPVMPEPIAPEPIAAEDVFSIAQHFPAQQPQFQTQEAQPLQVHQIQPDWSPFAPLVPAEVPLVQEQPASPVVPLNLLESSDIPPLQKQPVQQPIQQQAETSVVPVAVIPQILEQPVSLVIPFTQEQQEQPQQNLADSAPAALTGSVQGITSESTKNLDAELSLVSVHLAAPVPADSARMSVLERAQGLEPRTENSVVSALPTLDEGEVLIRNEVSRINYGTPSQRNLAVGQAVEPNPNPSASMPVSASEQRAPSRSDAEIVLQKPRAHSIQFVNSSNSTGNTSPARIHQQSVARQTETAARPPETSSATVSQTILPAATALPLVVPAASLPQERAGTREYSPFERRPYAVPSGNHPGTTFAGELQAPPLLKNSDAVTHPVR